MAAAEISRRIVPPHFNDQIRLVTSAATIHLRHFVSRLRMVAQWREARKSIIFHTNEAMARHDWARG